MEIATGIDALIRNRFPNDQAPGASVLVAQGGKILFAKGYGAADLSVSTPITPRTHFRLASVSKQFTAMAVLILCDEGKLKYTDRVTDLFPGFPSYGSSITIEHLLRHTSGLKDYEDLIPPEQTQQVHDRDVLEMMKSQPCGDFPAGSQYRYSNTGYATLAMAVERVSGMGFAEFLKRRIFGPAGMKETVAYEKGMSEVPDRAMGTREIDGRFEDADQGVTTAVLGDGGIYCSVEEYLQWDQALYSGKLVSPARLADAFSPGALADGQPTAYGFGWMLDENKGYKVVYHTGSTSGFNTCARRILELRLLVVVLCNRSGTQARELAPEIENLLLERLPKKR